MKIIPQVFLNSTLQLRFDIENWDLFGCSEALDNELKQFDKSKFAVPSATGGMVANSTVGGYFWRVSIIDAAQAATLKIKVFPTILFYDVDTSTHVGRVEGTAQLRGAIANELKRIFGNGSPGPGTISTAKKAGYSLAFLALLFFLKKKAMTEV